MKVLLVNKFLYPKGGAETYVFELGKTLEEYGHTVQYFGLENEKNIVGNEVNSLVSDMDFASGIAKNLTAPFRIIYSAEARRKLRRVLEDFKPDVIHLNNIQFHLTPSIILEAGKYRKKTGRSLKIIYTAHDYQLICPSHGLFDTDLNVCEKCLGGNFTHCFKTKCHKNSRMKSLLAMIDAYFWMFSKAYGYIDTIICPSKFLKTKLDKQKRFADKTVALHNFIKPQEINITEKGDYVLEFGHLSRDKGTNTLLEAAKRMPQQRFVFAGFGKAVEDIAKVDNAEYVGFKTGEELKELISKAKCSVYPSEWYENCPFSVMESQMYGTPVIGANIGGIPELIEVGKTGVLFESGNRSQLKDTIAALWKDTQRNNDYAKNCEKKVFMTVSEYCNLLQDFYRP